jgi:hypothetical protein
MIPLISYVLTTTSQAVTHIWESRWFESMYTVQGKIDTHDMCTFHANPCMPLVRFLWKVPVRGNLSLVINSDRHSHCSRGKKELLTASPPRRLTDPWVPIQFLYPSQLLKQWRKPSICRQQATSVYWAPISIMWSVYSILAHEGQPIGP